MNLDVEAALAALKKMTVGELKRRYGEVFGEPTRSNNKQHLVKRIIWRMQANQMGGLSDRARQRAKELANEADFRLLAPRPKPESTGHAVIIESPFHATRNVRLPMPGTLIRREYKGQNHEVQVLHGGFKYEGEVFRSLSAIAKKITGAHWNGPLFFRLTEPRRNRTNKEVVHA
jgi:Protein of unknown function (DUF2924)